MPATTTTIYAYSEAITNSNLFFARNMVFKNLFNDIITATIPGWSYISSSIPTPSSTAYDVHTAILESSEGFRIQIKTMNSSAYAQNLYVDVLNTTSGTIVTAANSHGTQICSGYGTYTFAIDISIKLIYRANNYYILRFESANQYTNYPPRAVGKIWLDNRSVVAPEWVLYSDFISTSRFYTISGGSLTLLNYSSRYDDNNYYLAADAYLNSSSLVYGKLKNAKVLNSTTGIPQYYSDGTNIYLPIAVGASFTIINLSA